MLNGYTDYNLLGSLLTTETHAPQIAYSFLQKWVCLFISITKTQICYTVCYYFFKDVLTRILFKCCWSLFLVLSSQFVGYHLLHVEPKDSTLGNFSANFPFGENSVRRKFRLAKIPSAKTPSAKIPSAKLPSAILYSYFTISHVWVKQASYIRSPMFWNVKLKPGLKSYKIKIYITFSFFMSHQKL